MFNLGSKKHNIGMVNFLRRVFIRDYQNLEDPKVRASHGVMSAVIGLFLNAVLFTLKFLSAILLLLSSGGILSMALLGDALNNGFDFLSSLISLIGFQISKKPADEDHPYGHGRSEYIAGMLVGVAIIVSAALLIYRSVQGIIGNEQISYDLFAFIALGATLPIKGLQAYLNFSLGKTLNSPTLKGVAFDATHDIILSSLLLTFALLSTYLSWPSLDNYLGIGTSCFLIFSGVEIIKESSSPLLGSPIDPELRESVEKMVLEDRRVHGVHDFICHTYGASTRYISFHVELDDSISLKAAHDIIDELEVKVSSLTHSSVLIHPDPIPVHDQKLDAYREKVTEILSSIDPEITFHDLHFKKETLHMDILLPFKKAGLKRKITEKLHLLGIPLSLTFDHPY